jgi:hypothetical protein
MRWGGHGGGALISLFTLEELINGWRHGFPARPSLPPLPPT